MLHKLFWIAIMLSLSCRKEGVKPISTSTNLDGSYTGTANTLILSTGQTMAYPVRVEISGALWRSNTNKENNPFHLKIAPDPDPGYREGQVLVESAVNNNNTIVTFWSYLQNGQTFSGELPATSHPAPRSYIVFLDPNLGQPAPYSIDPKATIQGGLDNDSLTITLKGEVKDNANNKIGFDTRIAAKRVP